LWGKSSGKRLNSDEKYLTKMKFPEFIESLSLPLSSKEEKRVEKLDSSMGVETARSRFTPYWSPHTGNYKYTNKWKTNEASNWIERLFNALNMKKDSFHVF